MRDLGERLDNNLMRLDDQAIAEYLQENPDFFERHPALLSQMSIRHEAQGSISLIERQQKILREQIGVLQEEITTLMANARRNERIFHGYSELYMKLLRCKSIEEVEAALQQCFLAELNLAQLSLKLFAPLSGHAARLQFSADTHKQLLSKRFTNDPVYLGRLTQDEHRLLFADSVAAEHIESVALLLLGGDEKLGILALGSHDPSHFEPSMDYLLISQLQALLSSILPDLAE
ncbi:MAG: DUF484 family protein [Gammaproteobacteria bacterium]|nr:DUF484 family protein [Gammaproteobacteria bacterium]